MNQWETNIPGNDERIASEDKTNKQKNNRRTKCQLINDSAFVYSPMDDIDIDMLIFRPYNSIHKYNTYVYA